MTKRLTHLKENSQQESSSPDTIRISPCCIFCDSVHMHPGTALDCMPATGAQGEHRNLFSVPPACVLLPPVGLCMWWRSFPGSPWKNLPLSTGHHVTYKIKGSNLWLVKPGWACLHCYHYKLSCDFFLLWIEQNHRPSFLLSLTAVQAHWKEKKKTVQLKRN